MGATTTMLARRHRQTQSHSARRLILLTPPLALLLTASSSRAADVTARLDARNNARQDRSAIANTALKPNGPSTQRLLSIEEAPEETPEFKITPSVTYQWTDNGGQTQANKVSEWYADPGLDLNWNHTLENSVLSADVSVDFERHATVTSSDGDNVVGQFHWAFGNGADPNAFMPYVGYEPTISYEPTFGQHVETDHDVLAGFTKTFYFDDNLVRQHPTDIDAANKVPTSVAFASTIGYRFANPSDGRATRLKLKATISHTISEAWSFALSQSLLIAWYDHRLATADNPNPTTRLIEPISTLEFDYAPSWINVGPLRNGGLALTAQFTRADANQPAARFSQWVLGPGLSFFWKF